MQKENVRHEHNGDLIVEYPDGKFQAFACGQGFEDTQEQWFDDIESARKWLDRMHGRKAGV